MHCARTHRYQGFSLLETLIASALLASTLLGLGALASQSLQFAALTRDQFIASALLTDLEGRMALTGGALAWQSGDALTAGERARWLNLAQQRLSRAQLDLCRDASPLDGDRGVARCDGTGPLVAKLHYRSPLLRQDQRQTRLLPP